MRIPLATYRLQFSSSFRFQDAGDLVPYLSELGISDIYASPILKATRGSTHGYDVTDPDELNPELGTQEDFQTLTARVQSHGLGWLQDIVPNHMAYSSENRMLMDLFENGSRSRFHAFFDVFRDHPDPELRTRVLAPFLGGSLEEILQRGEIKLALDDDGLSIRYFDRCFPLYLPTYAGVLWHDQRLLSGSMTGDDPAVQVFLKLRDTFSRLADTEDSPEKRRRVAGAKALLARLHEQAPMIRLYIDGELDYYNRPPGGPVEQSPLFTLLEQQLFKLVPWRVAYEVINYRRFFYVSDFIALHTEDPQVFERIHARTFALARTGVFTGLRIDHVDGLYNPRAYLAALRDALPDCYIAVEKILELYEFLPGRWPIQGTSGYRFCNMVNGVFCRKDNEASVTQVYHDFIGDEPDYGQLLYDEKKKVLEWRMSGELTYLAHLASQLLPGDDPHKAETVRQALTALMAAFPVYRTYVDARDFTEQDRTMLAAALDKARDKCPACRPHVDQIVDLLLSGLQNGLDPRTKERRQYFLMRFQQFTGPAMAKGFEDTLLYVYNRLLSLNEVGGDPNTFGVTLDQFHRFHELRARNWPHAMSATSTHDSKRGEDVRARLNVLSEIPDHWRQAVNRWAQLNRVHKQRAGDILAPHPNDEYFLYQTLVGALPFEESEYDSFAQRIGDYMIKATREAKTRTNWVDTNEAYEAACRHFVERVLDRSADNRFWPDFLAFQKEISGYGVYNSLSQTTLKITCPGVPDFYQGTELWDLNLVDPDNRRPVDFQKRKRLLDAIASDTDLNPQSAIADPQRVRDGRIKLFLIQKALRVRAQNRDLFEKGDYLPATVTGSRADHVIAFFRRRENNYALTVAPRFVASLIKPGELLTDRCLWQDTRIELPPRVPSSWRNTISGTVLTAVTGLLVADILREFPVSLLVPEVA